MQRRIAAALLVCASFLIAAPGTNAASLPYDESANAELALQSGLTTAQQQHKHLLVIFGANWCPDCRALDKALQGRTGKLIDSKFIVVKVDVGNFDKNLSLSEHYGSPIKKGIPAAVVVTAEDKLLYSTKAGELANARNMSETGIYDFFRKIIDAP